MLKNTKCWYTWLAKLVEHVTVDLGDMNSSPMLSVEVTKKIVLKTQNANEGNQRRSKDLMEMYRVQDQKTRYCEDVNCSQIDL